MTELIDTIKNMDNNLTSAQQEQVEKCEDFYNNMKQMGLAGKQDFNGETSPITNYGRPNNTISCFW